MKLVNVTKSIQDKKIEVEYNEKTFFINGKKITVQYRGKIKCPVLNTKISPLVCSKEMEKPNWPRACDPNICSKLGCKIHASIEKNSEKKTSN